MRLNSRARSRAVRHTRSCFWKSPSCHRPKASKPVVTSGGTMPKDFRESALAVWKHTISVMGSPQNRAESPRTSRPSERNSAGLGAESGMPQLDRDMRLEAQVGVLLQPALVIIEKAHGFGGFHAVGFDGLVDLPLHLPLQFILIVLDRGKALDDGAAFDDLFNVVAGRLVGFEEHMDFVYAAEQVVQVAHDVLVCAHQEEAEVVRLRLAVAVGIKLMQRQGVPHVAEVDEFVHLPVGIAGDIDQRGLTRGTFGEAADRHDREQLAERPMIEQRLEHREIAEVLVAEAVLELADFFRDVSLAFEALDDLATDVPIKLLDLGLLRQVHHAEREHVLRVFLPLQRVVIRLQLVQLLQIIADVDQFLHQRRIGLSAFGAFGQPAFFDCAEHLHNQHAVMGDNCPTALADDVGVRHLLRVADIGDVINDVIGVFLERVIGGAVEGGPAAVVIHAQAAADVEVFDLKPHLVKLGVKAGSFLNRLLDDENVRHLRADMEMEQFEAVSEILRLEHFRSGQQLGRAQTELGVFTGALRPFAGAAAQEARADADDGLDAELPGQRDDLAQLLELLDDHDHLLVQFGAEQRHANETSVLVAVADNQAALLVLHGEAGEQLRLAADLQAELVRLARIQNLFNHLA